MRQETLKTYHQAVAMYEAALKFAPNDFKILKRFALALERLSELQFSCQQHQDAIDTLKQTIATYKTAFEQTPNNVQNINYLAMLVERLAQQQFSQKQYIKAFLTYQQAAAIYETLLVLAPNDYCFHALQAGVFTSIADFHISLLSQHTIALEKYQQAIILYDISFSLKPVEPIEFDKARTLQKIGYCLQQLSSKQEALRYYQATMEIFKRVLPANSQHLIFLEQDMQQLLVDLNSQHGII